MSFTDKSVKASVPLGRLLACMYIAALLVGPAPWGWGFGFRFLSPVVRALPGPLPMFVAFGSQFIIPALIAGFIAGKRLGVWAGLLGAMLTEGYHLQMLAHTIPEVARHSSGVMAYLLSAVSSVSSVATFYGPALLGVPALFGWLGGRLSSRLKVGQALDGWRHWRKLGVVAALMIVYAFTLGKSTAFHTVHTKFAKIWPSDSSKISVWSAGVYPAVNGVTGCKGCGFPDTYYTDPTGLVFMYKRNLD